MPEGKLKKTQSRTEPIACVCVGVWVWVGGALAGTILFFLNLFFLWEGLLLATCLSMPPKVPPRGPSRHYLYQDRRGGERTPVKAFQTSCQVFLGEGKVGDGLKTLLHVLAALGGGWGTAAT